MHIREVTLGAFLLWCNLDIAGAFLPVARTSSAQISGFSTCSRPWNKHQCEESLLSRHHLAADDNLDGPGQKNTAATVDRKESFNQIRQRQGQQGRGQQGRGQQGRGRQGRGQQGRGQQGRGQQRRNNNNNNWVNKSGGTPQQLAQAKAINKELINAESAQEVLTIFSSKGGAKGVAGGGVFNSVNYSTLMHRLARFANFVDYSQQRNNRNNNQAGRGGGRGGGGRGRGGGGGINVAQEKEEKRKLILSDPRTAILMASLAEALVAPKSNKLLKFNSRELANLGWALAKLKLSPPAKIFPIVRPNELLMQDIPGDWTNSGPDIVPASLEEMHKDLALTATKVRAQVLEVAKQRSTMQTAAERSTVKNLWIPTMSQLAGKLLDVIATQVLDNLDDFNTQELANLLYAFANAGRADHILFQRLSDQLVKTFEEKAQDKNIDERRRAKPQEFSNSVWAFASAGLRCQGQVDLVKTVADAMDRNDGSFVREFKPQELSNTAWGTATLLSKRAIDKESTKDDVENDAAVRIYRWVANELMERVDQFKPQEVSNSIWAFATIGFGAAQTSIQFNTNNEYICLPSDQAEEDRMLVTNTLDIVAKSAMERLPRFRPQELNNLAWGFCRLGHHNALMDELFDGIGKELMRRHHYFKPQDIGTSLWSMATVEYFNEDVYRAAASELTLRKSQSFKPQELSNTVWAIATAGMQPRFANAFDTTILAKSKRSTLSQVTSDPISECFAAATTELMRRPNQFKPQEIKDVLWSLSKAGVRHPGVFKSVAEYLVGSDADANQGRVGRGMDGFSPQGLGNLAWSYAKQAQLAADVNNSKIGSTGRLAVYETICLDVGENLSHRLFAGIAEAAISDDTGLSRYKPQDLSNTCWAFATLGLLHRRFFDTVADEVRTRLNPSNSFNANFKAQEIANLVWSFATLNHQCKGMLHSFTPYVVKMCNKGKSKGVSIEKVIARFFKRQEVANIAWSCAVLEEYPEELLPLLYTALFGSATCTSEDLKRIYGDGGIQKATVMTMFYVQMALDMEAPDLGLELPENFPQGWKDDNNSITDMIASVDSTDTSMLQLTTSRLQQTISGVLGKVGFEHVLEHIISTDELQDDYGISLSTENLEFLSLDIANLESKIGIEVDGPGHFVNILDGSNDVTGSDGGAINTVRGKRGWQFMANSQQHVNGPTALKHRLMEHLGWSVGHIPYYEWREQKDVEEYCREMINDL